MADNNEQATGDNSPAEKSSFLRTAFQYVAAFGEMATGGSAPRMFAHAGFTWDYCKAAVGSQLHRGPKL